MDEQTETRAADEPASAWKLHVVNEAVEAISGSLDEDLLVERILVFLMRAFGCSASAIQLRDETSGVLRVRGIFGFGTDQFSALFSETDGLWPGDRAVATGEPVVVDVGEQQQTEQLEVEGQPVRSLLCIPIIAGDYPVGVLTLASVVPGRFEDGERRLVAVISRHLATAVRNARLYEQSQRARVEWERTFDAMSDPVAVFDGDGRIVRANAALASVNGWPVNAVVGRTCHEVGFCGETRECAVGRAIKFRLSSREEVTRPDGQVYVTTTVPIVEEGRGRVSVVQVAKNVTEEIKSARQLKVMSEELAATNTRLTGALDQLKTAQARMVQSEKLVAIGQLVAGVAHELNNPLTSVIGYAQLLEDELLPSQNGSAGVVEPQSVLSDVRRIGDEAQRAARIVRNLLAFARRQGGARTLLHVPDLVGGVLSLRAYELEVGNITVDLSFEPDLPSVYGDGNQLQQALLNLILNAEQAMKGNTGRGHLGISARFERDAQAVLIEVSDDGCGIDTLHVARVFDPFFTTKPVGAGTGLGLSISYGIIRDHGGDISVESSPGSGATFSILLPARLTERADAGPALRLLLAHGDSHAREFLAAVFTGWGYDVTTASTANEALDWLGRLSPDVGLIDRSILEGHVTQWQDALPRVASEVAFVFTSIKEEGDEIGRLARAYGRAFVDPPFQLGTLRDALRAAAKERV